MNTTLPANLIEAATRVCREVHHDSPEAVRTMLADLRTYPPSRWPWLVEHFTAQLAGVPQRTPTCGGCQHATVTEHPVIHDCALGVPSGLPIAGRWATDQHDCHEFIDRSPTGTETQDRDHHPFSFLETNT